MFVTTVEGRRAAVFDAGAYLTLVATGNSNGPHTIEFEAYLPSLAKQGILSMQTSTGINGGVAALITASGTLDWREQGAAGAEVPITVGWHRFALVHDGVTARLYVDGVQAAAFAVSTSGSAISNIYIGYAYETTNHNSVAGFAVRQLRFYRGVALYTGAPYDVATALAGVASDATELAWLEGGAPALDDGALVLNSSSYLHCPGFNFGSADFTIEGWFDYTGTAANWPRLFNQTGSGAGLFWTNISSDGRLGLVFQGSLNTLAGTRAVGRTTITPGPHHYALVRKGNAVCFFLDGQAEFAVATSGVLSALNRFAIGTVSDNLGNSSNFTGAVDDFRVTIGKARYDFTLEPNFFNTVFIERPNGTSFPFTNNNRNKLVTQAGAVAILEADPFGGTDYMLRLNGTSSYASIPTHADFNFGAGDFTVEWWGKNSGTTAEKHCVFASGNTTWGAGAVGIYQNGAFVLLASYENGDPVVTASGDYSVGWHHFVVERIGGVARIYVDGVLSASAACASAINFGTTITYFGKSGWSTTQNYNGDITDLRVTKGVARYDADFTPSRIVEVTGSFTPPPVGSLPIAATAISGVVRDSGNNPCERKVFAYSHETGRYLGTATSDPVTGVFEIAVPERAFVVALDTDASGQNAIVLDRVDPV